jgi:hypothetical protein
MKKIALLLALLVLVASLCACGGKTEEVTETTTEVETTNDNVSINIKKELIQDVESYKAENSKYEGVTITETEDLIILNMNAASYDKFVEIKHTEAINAYDALLEQEGTFVEKFDYDLNFRSVKVYVNREKYDAVSHNSTEYITYAANALAYQMYLPNGQQCTVQVIYSDTQEVIGTTTLPNQIELK